MVSMAMALSLVGCGHWELPGSQALFIYVQHGVGSSSNSASKLADEDVELQRLLQDLIARYRRKNPRARIHVRSFAADDLGPEMRLRQSSGLGPDLVISDVRVAFELHDQGLTTPVRIPAERLNDIAAPVIRRFEQNGALLALPFSLQPQIACFNRRRINQPPQKSGGGIGPSLNCALTSSNRRSSTSRPSITLDCSLHQAPNCEDRGRVLKYSVTSLRATSSTRPITTTWRCMANQGKTAATCGFCASSVLLRDRRLV